MRHLIAQSRLYLFVIENESSATPSSKFEYIIDFICTLAFVHAVTLNVMQTAELNRLFSILEGKEMPRSGVIREGREGEEMPRSVVIDALNLWRSIIGLGSTPNQFKT